MTGKYARDFSKLFPESLEVESRAILEVMLAPEKFQYLISQHRANLYDRYIDGILMIHDISFRQYSDMPADSKRQFENGGDWFFKKYIMIGFRNDKEI